MRGKGIAWVLAATLGLWLAAAPPAQAAWVGDDITVQGSTQFEAGGKLRLTAWGADIWGRYDRFRYAYRSMAGDFDISVRVTDLVRAPNYWTKVGLMVRESLKPDSANEFILLRRGNPAVVRQWRPVTREPSQNIGLTLTGSGENVWLRLVRSGNTVTAYWAPGNAARPTSDSSTTDWDSLGSSTVGWTGGCLGLALTSHECNREAEATFQELHDHATNSDLDPATFLTSSKDISVYKTGSLAQADGQLTIQGDGSDIWGEGDSFYLVHGDAKRSGDFTAIARVVSVVNAGTWGRLGLMARESTAAGSVCAHVSVTPASGTFLQGRESTGALVSGPALPGAPGLNAGPIWLLLRRSGQKFTAAWAPDVGGTPGGWSGAVELTSPHMPQNVELGPNVCSNRDGTRCTAVFDNVSVGGLAPVVWVDANWTGPGNCGGHTWFIDAFNKIQDGIDAVAAGGTVHVAAGTYNESLTWDTKSISLLGADAALTTVDAAGTGGRCLTILSVPTTATLQGFRFTGGSEVFGGGIYLSQSSPTIQNCSITANSSTSSGGGLYLADSSPTLIGNIISDNTAGTDRDGGGVFMTHSSPTLDTNTITRNTASRHGGGLFLDKSSPTLEDNHISFNHANRDGGGLGLDDDCNPILRRNSIVDNTADNGGGMNAGGSSPVLTDNNVVTGNIATYGGGLRFVWSSPTIENNYIHDNQATNSGGAILFREQSSALISTNDIAHNTAGAEGGAIHLIRSSPTFTDNTIASNSASTGGGVFIKASAPTLTHNTIWDNHATSVGGGLRIHSSAGTLDDNTISNNSSGSRGGGLYFDAGSTTSLTANTISANSAPAGGGLAIYYGSAVSLTNNNIIEDNTATAWPGGAGLYINESPPTHTNNTI